MLTVTHRPVAHPSSWGPGRRPACRRRSAACRPAALFGFGGSKAEDKAAAPKAAPAVSDSGPILTPFTPIQKGADYSLRLYSAYPVAETEYERRDEGFMLLGSYMSGNNVASARCRETQPVVMSYPPQGAKRMQIHVLLRSADAAPSSLPPAPGDPAVTLGVAGGEVVAARLFEGYATQQACESNLQALRTALERDGLKLAEAEAEGFFRLAQYGPIHTMQARTNEIWLAVKLG